MNKKICIYALTLSAILMIGCGMRDKSEGGSPTDTTPPSSTGSTQPSQSVKPSQTDTTSDQNPTGQLSTNDSGNDGQPITEAEAKTIALRHAGLKENEVTFGKVKFEPDEVREHFDVEFKSQSGIEYDYEIDYYTGEIIEYDYDIDDDQTHPDDGTNASTDQKKVTEGASKAR